MARAVSPLTFKETSNHHITGLCPPPSNSPTIRMTQILDLLKALTSTGNKLILTPT